MKTVSHWSPVSFDPGAPIRHLCSASNAKTLYGGPDHLDVSHVKCATDIDQLSPACPVFRRGSVGPWASRPTQPSPQPCGPRNSSTPGGHVGVVYTGNDWSPESGLGESETASPLRS